MCAYLCAQLSYTTQHRTVLIIFSLILQTIIIAQMMSTGGEGRRSVMMTRLIKREYSLATRTNMAHEFQQKQSYISVFSITISKLFFTKLSDVSLSWKWWPGSILIDIINKLPPPHHTTTVLRPFFWEQPGELVPGENFWTLRCKGRFAEGEWETHRPSSWVALHPD